MRRSSIGVLSILGFGLTLALPTHAAGPASAHHARGSAGVFWFMHISDLHTSCDWNPTDEQENMQLAFGPAVQLIKPSFLAATGDLVDASPFGVPTTGQGQAEWDQYQSLYTAAGLTPDFYYDLPGNHDGYGDVGFDYYLASSLQGSTNHSTYHSWDVDTALGTYRFIGLDSAGNGSGPFSEQPVFLPEQIAAMQADLAASPAPELVFVLAHHPITTPENSSQVVDLLKGVGGGFYLHGHVHAYDEYSDGDPSIVVNEVSTLGQSGSDNIAVGVVDHNAFVYRATGSAKPWPFVIVTAPVSRTLRNGETNPYAYEVCKDRTDNPVRALVFGASPPSSVTVQVGSTPAVAMTEVPQQKNLWEAEVDTSALGVGPNDVTVSALVAGQPASHTISAMFASGPCAPLPDDAPADAGSDAGPTPTADAGTDTGGAAGAGETGGSAGSGGSAGAVTVPSTHPSASQDSSGCACRESRAETRSRSVPLALALAGLALGWKRRHNAEARRNDRRLM